MNNKWIWLAILCVLIFASASIAVFTKARAPLNNMQQIAEEIAYKEANIKTIEKTYLYNGSKSYFVIIGKQEKDKRIAVWIPENSKEKIIIKNMDDGISEKAALNKLIQEEKPEKILGIRLGMEKKLPVWEIAYLDSRSKLNYYYIHFETGKWWRKIENL